MPLPPHIISNPIERRTALVPSGGGHLYAEILTCPASAEAPVLFLLRGWGRSVRHWLGFETQMAQHYRVVTLDARGIGRSSAHPGWLLSTESMAADVSVTMDHLQIPLAHVMGVSLGGMVALRFGQIFPHRARSVIAVNASFRGSMSPRLTPAALATIVRGALNKPNMSKFLSQSLLSKGISSSLRADIEQRWHEIDQIETLSPLVALKQLLAAARFAKPTDMATISIPSLLLYGSDDRFVSKENTKKLARIIPNSRLQAIEEAGHEPSLDQPDRLERALRDFINEVENNLC